MKQLTSTFKIITKTCYFKLSTHTDYLKLNIQYKNNTVV
jgi:hypothetical protein